jgi:hypothetical protein
LVLQSCFRVDEFGIAEQLLYTLCSGIALRFEKRCDLRCVITDLMLADRFVMGLNAELPFLLSGLRLFQ